MEEEEEVEEEAAELGEIEGDRACPHPKTMRNWQTKSVVQMGIASTTGHGSPGTHSPLATKSLRHGAREGRGARTERRSVRCSS